MKKKTFMERVACVLLGMMIMLCLTAVGGYAAVNGLADALVPAEAVELVSQIMKETISSEEMGIVENEKGTFDLKTGERVFYANVIESGSIWRCADKKGGTSGNLQAGQRILLLEEPSGGMYQVVSSLSDNKAYGWFPEEKLERIDLSTDADAAKEFDIVTKLAGYGFLGEGTRFVGPDGQAMTLLRIDPAARNVKSWRELERNGVPMHEFTAGEFAFAVETTLTDRAQMFSLDGKDLGYSSMGKLDADGKPKMYWQSSGDGFLEKIAELRAEGYELFDPNKEANELQAAQDAIDGYVAQHTEPLEATIDGLKTDVASRDAQIAELNKQVEALNKENEELHGVIDTANAEKETLTAERDELAARLDELASEAAEANTRIEELEKALEEAEAAKAENATDATEATKATSPTK